MINLQRVTFGGTAAIVTSMGLIVGLDAATVSKGTIVGSLLLVALADNLTDSLSVHMYQESERLPEREAFRSTVTNFFARLLVALSFVGLFLFVPTGLGVVLSMVWGFCLLSVLSYSIARRRSVAGFSEIWKHAAVAVAVIVVSKAIGAWIMSMTFAG
jgi:hypothetical protein